MQLQCGVIARDLLNDVFSMQGFAAPRNANELVNMKTSPRFFQARRRGKATWVGQVGKVAARTIDRQCEMGKQKVMIVRRGA